MIRNAEKLEKLKKLQAARAGKQSDVREDDDKLYDEIDEQEYRIRKRQELLQDDFVVDDDGLGYVDRGVDYDRNQVSDEESEEEVEESSVIRSSKSQDGATKDRNAVSNLLRAQHNKARLSMQKGKPKEKNISVDQFDDILSEFGDGVPYPRRQQFKRKIISSPTVLHVTRKPAGSFEIDSSEIDSGTFKKQKLDADKSVYQCEDIDSSPLRSRGINNKNNSEAKSNKTKFEQVDDHSLNIGFSDVEEETFKVKSEQSQNGTADVDLEEDSDDEIVFGRRTLRTVKTARHINLSSGDIHPSSPFVTAPGTPISMKSSQANIGISSSGEAGYLGGKYTREQIVDPATNSFQMFWLDYCEVDGSLVLFGKIKTNDNTIISGMVQINGLCRELYFLPRENKTPQDIHEEIIPLLLDKFGLDNIRAKPVKRKYCFELPEIPSESEYLQVLLPYNCPKSKRDMLPPDLSSENFSHVFGGNANIFESFVLQNKIMGPCWLEIKNGDFHALANASNCAAEVAVNISRNITLLDVKKSPNLSAVSLAIQTMMNLKENKQEIIAITISSYKEVPLDAPIPEETKPNDVVTLLRPPRGTSFPLGLATLTKQKVKGNVRLFNNEKSLLSCFCAILKVSDPDVIIGHRLESIYLDLLAHRLHDLAIPTFNALGRRARKVWPDRFGRSNSGMNHIYIRELVAGRLICDIANDMGQSLTPKCQSWDLAEMYQVSCGVDHKSLDINYQNPQYQDDANSMIMALTENIKNSAIIAEISFRIQLLSLTRQLTNLAGNAWSQTLGGTRAGRNEYILLHEFSRNCFIVPDKENNRFKSAKQSKMHDISTEREPEISSKKAKFQGGLVFEPEKGLHSNYVLVMDFNSLYPSIIQEFNICFTTVDRNLNDADELPETPDTDKDQGVLPRLLATLVQRRREVKKIMATETDAFKKAQCDIRQQALKLTANSMYGCLGYVNSRFYAQPLAMLVTNKGREILMNTRQLAESMNLLVVYGDTDSVMIDSGCDNYADAVKIGNNFKKLVNERYRLLEIDIDNVFKKLLLHAKKKYAALSVSLDKDGQERALLEVKGLDMKRREFCPLSKDVSIHVLETILSDTDSETALQETYEYLENVRAKIENNEIRIDRYKINTRLSKDPSAYNGGKSMPAVQVALGMRKNGRVVKAGTVITFVITEGSDCTPNESKDSAQSVAERARALNEVMVKNSNLRPDAAYYLEKQIFAPVERLLERIEGFDIRRLGESLGLDSKRFINRGINLNDGMSRGNGIDDLQPLESTIPDVERFKDTANLELACPSCRQKFLFGGIVASNYYSICYNGLQCKKCNHMFTPLQTTCQLERCIRSHISLYYAGWLHCDDPTCGNVTRQISVFGKRCLVENCTGVMGYRYSDKQLYNQLLYFDSLFNCEKNKKQEIKPLYHSGDEQYPKEQLTDSSIKALAEQNRELMNLNRGIVQKYLSDCGRRYVDMGNIFEFMI
ncbi:hypothetical protein HG535_0A02920 [Zygotorulaspora mrakii]|uniref:DNA polymerase n=1 Tax=Zygotorulaspora mrakii TaxID=42260 RepID=A0A7H9AVY5_ZYGMR|nr:uncharacterized protein HG535_0A02920 [Zygotorulaspora mrakii]QLG70353.1 hypothetical protein HG535_0A02920 [Zygotorulaspora mrakii]